ncbi:MAG: thiamine pyrophosphate-dependent dehydrogenase E1 component subunit alpha [SAR324 cluster bacterium]|nr:thiamine pyrophosphate-dependent dehydrogenase E1 component subunit alpha [SAR324 cluster bacterium]
MKKSSPKKDPVVHLPEFVTGSALSFPILKILKEDGTLYKDAVLPLIDREKALKIYDTFLFLRIFDERMLAAQRQGRISFFMTSTGEEATHVGSAAALQDDDMVMAQYREPGPLYFRGFTTANFMNQLFSNEQDLGKGRQMPVHYGSKKLNYMTISSPLATQIPQSVGYAYAQKIEGSQSCTLCFFGEGAASEGDFHAAMNMATLFEVPLIFFCRNNHYAISTPSEQQFAADGIAPRGVGYGMKTIRIDGNDVLAVMKATEEARKLAVEKNEPILIEAMTYRLGAHSTSDDPSGYRSRKEENRWKKSDPVLRMKKWLLAQEWWSEKEDQEAMDTKREEVRNEMQKAEKIPVSELSSLVTDVYDKPPWHLQEQLAELEQHIRRYPKEYPKSSWRFKND